MGGCERHQRSSRAAEKHFWRWGPRRDPVARAAAKSRRWPGERRMRERNVKFTATHDGRITQHMIQGRGGPLARGLQFQSRLPSATTRRPRSTRSSFASSSEICCARHAPAAVDEPQHGLAQADDVARALRAPPQPCPRRTRRIFLVVAIEHEARGPCRRCAISTAEHRCASWSSRRTASTSGIWSQRAPRCSRMHHEITQVGRRRKGMQDTAYRRGPAVAAAAAA